MQVNEKWFAFHKVNVIYFYDYFSDSSDEQVKSKLIK